MSPSVLSEVIDTAGSMKIGLATLNRPATLNSLDLEMCHELTRLLTEWENDPAIALVLLRGAGDRAFCAGGDLHSVYQSMLENAGGKAWDNAFTREFFDVEYRLDYQIHTYPKPVLCWASGIVMGGGVGLMLGASHRVMTDTTRFAMPEITIGLFPDVGGSWMLNRLPDGLGQFLALTGAQLGAADCERLGLADYTLSADGFEALLQALKEQDWQGSSAANDRLLAQMLDAHRAPAELEATPLQKHAGLIRHHCSGRDFEAICASIAGWQNDDDPWLQRAARTFLAGSPGSARLSFELMRRSRFMSLADVFRMEYIAALHCAVHGDLQEGIRALLIDKDRQPAWNPASLDQATTEWVERFFAQPWPAGGVHPLQDLGVH